MSNNNVKALKSGAWYTFANFIMKSMVFISTPVFARMLTKEEYGLYSNYTSWLMTATIVVTLNIYSTFISAKTDFKDDFDTYILSTTVLSVSSSLLWIVIINVFSTEIVSLTGLSIFYLNIMMVYILFDSIVQIFQTRERYKYEYKKSVFLSLIISIGNTALSIVLVYAMTDKLTGRIIGNSFLTIVIGIALGIYMIIKGRRVRIEYWKYALPICLPFIPHLLSLMVLNVLDRIMITQICGAEENALYSLAYSCGAIVSLLITSMNTAFSPWLGEKLEEESYEEICGFSDIYVKGFSFFACGLILISPEVLLIMGGEAYMSAIYVMPPVAFGFVCQFIYTMFVNIEQFKKKTIGMAFASAFAAVLNFILNIIFIPMFGYVAAAYTTMVSYLFLLVFHSLLVHRMGLMKVYKGKTIVVSLIIVFVFSMIVNLLFSYNFLRYIFIVFYILVLAVFIKKHYKRFLSIIKK